MKKLTLEQAEKILEELEPAMPDGFSVVKVAYFADDDMYLVRWIDPAEKDTYDSQVAGRDAAETKGAYGYTPGCGFSAVWFNEAEDDPGVMKPSAQILSEQDIEQLSKSGKKFILLDTEP